MLKTCKVCLLEKPAVQGVWKMKHGKPEGRTCLACHNATKQAKRATEEGRAKHNAANARCHLARLKTDAWYRLKQQLAGETRQILKQLAVGKGTDYICLKLFGADRATVYAHIDKQLQTKGFSWKNHGEEWVLDHRIPLAMAQSSIELYQLCLLDNCQVLTPAENDAKRLEDVKLIREFEAQLV